MCDFSLKAVKTRDAKVGDKLITKDFGTGTRGFCAVDDTDCAVCLMPGTELAFDEPITIMGTSFIWGTESKSVHKTAIFRQFNKDQPHMHHDAIEYPDGGRTMLTMLVPGQALTVLQLPAKPKTAEEAKDQQRLEYHGN